MPTSLKYTEDRTKNTEQNRQQVSSERFLGLRNCFFTNQLLLTELR